MSHTPPTHYFVIMDETAKRLLEAGQKKGYRDFAEIARAIDATDQTMTNWKYRGVSKQGIIKAAVLLGVDATWLAGLPHGAPPTVVSEVTARDCASQASDRMETRRLALLDLITICVPARFANARTMAEALGFSPAHFSQLKSGNRPIGNKSADKIEQGLGLSRGTLDVATPTQPIAAESPVLGPEPEPISDASEQQLREGYRVANAGMREAMMSIARAALSSYAKRAKKNP